MMTNDLNTEELYKEAGIADLGKACDADLLSVLVRGL